MLRLKFLFFTLGSVPIIFIHDCTFHFTSDMLTKLPCWPCTAWSKKPSWPSPVMEPCLLSGRTPWVREVRHFSGTWSWNMRVSFSYLFGHTGNVICSWPHELCPLGSNSQQRYEISSWIHQTWISGSWSLGSFEDGKQILFNTAGPSSRTGE